jgi:hypothetical protein
VCSPVALPNVVERKMCKVFMSLIITLTGISPEAVEVLGVLIYRCHIFGTAVECPRSVGILIRAPKDQVAQPIHV